MRRWKAILLASAMLLSVILLMSLALNQKSEYQSQVVQTTSVPVTTPEEVVKVTKVVEEQQGKVIVIDAGHQLNGNYQLEPIGPGARTKKPKVSSGTVGRFTKVPEYVLNLSVSLKLEKALKKEGYQIIMIRRKNEVNLSNRERASIANKAKADAFIRIHANGSTNAKVHGIVTLCPTSRNSFCSTIAEKSGKLSYALLKGMIDTTGAKDNGVSRVDNMSGINWSKVPVSIVEMGYMTNPKEDRLMQTQEYQNKLVKGMVLGIKEYFRKQR